MDKQRDQQIHGQTNKSTDTQPERHINKQTYAQANAQTENTRNKKNKHTSRQTLLHFK